MLSKLRPRSAYDVIALLALVVGLVGTGSAIAAIVVSSNSQVAQNTISGHKPPSGKHANIIAESINGKDIADNSGVETCPNPFVTRFGRTCAGSDGGERDWPGALAYCAKKGLRVPTVSEAITLARRFDVPGVESFNIDNFAQNAFWTADYWQQATTNYAGVVTEEGGTGAYNADSGADKARTVCVTNPSV